MSYEVMATQRTDVVAAAVVVDVGSRDFAVVVAHARDSMVRC